MIGGTKSIRMVYARRFIIHILHEHCGMSYPKINRAIGRGRGHSTTVEAHAKFKAWRREGKTYDVWDGQTFAPRTTDEVLAMFGELEVTDEPK